MLSKRGRTSSSSSFPSTWQAEEIDALCHSTRSVRSRNWFHPLLALGGGKFFSFFFVRFKKDITISWRLAPTHLWPFARLLLLLQGAFSIENSILHHHHIVHAMRQRNELWPACKRQNVRSPFKTWRWTPVDARNDDDSIPRPLYIYAAARGTAIILILF